MPVGCDTQTAAAAGPAPAIRHRPVSLRVGGAEPQQRRLWRRGDRYPQGTARRDGLSERRAEGPRGLDPAAGRIDPG
jgi:hypothetical protein